MPILTINELKPGMTADKETRNSRGQLLIPEGEVINEQHLRALKIWGIHSIHIKDENREGSKIEVSRTEDANRKKEILKYTARLFSVVAVKPIHPVIQELIRISAGKMEKKGVPRHASLALENESGAPEVEGVPKLTVSGLISDTRDLFSMPDIYHKLTEVINSPYGSAADIAQVISYDPGLTARLLRIVNSAFYGFPSKIESVAQGVTILGTKELCDLALATSVIAIFDEVLKGVVDMDLFWHHSIGCGIFARKFAMFRQETGVERFFVMGILHDIGRLILFSQVPKVMAMVSLKASKSRISMHKAEKELLGFSHTDVGQALLKEWRLPVNFQETVLHHHHPSQTRRFGLEAAIVHMADLLAAAMCMGSSGSKVVSAFKPGAWDRLELELSLLPRIIEESEEETKDLIRIFKG